jgi:NAD(P)-dependent dehydrogenase (short-subunit alcohol dehydrogenase family)
MDAAESRVVIVTGGSTGLGRSMVLALLAAGHRLSVVARTDATLEELRAAAHVAQAHERLLTQVGDVTSPEDCATVVAHTRDRFGAIDALVNNAGVNRSTRERQDYPNFWQVTIDDWRRIIETNINGGFFMSHAVVPHLIDRGWGRIVNHLAGLRTMVGPGHTPLGPSKAALEAMTSAWASELEGTGVTVNAISPGGAADTRMSAPEVVPDRSRLVPPAVMGPPICWLISRGSDGFTGHRIDANRWDDGKSARENVAHAARVAGWKELLP